MDSRSLARTFGPPASSLHGLDGGDWLHFPQFPRTTDPSLCGLGRGDFDNINRTLWQCDSTGGLSRLLRVGDRSAGLSGLFRV